MEAHNLTETYPYVTKLLSHGGDFTLRIERGASRYTHENTVSAEVSFADSFIHVLPTDDELREAIVRQWDVDLEREYDKLTQETTDIIRGYCRDLYNQLEEEYEYLTSDEAVWEAIEANELDQTEDEEETV